MSQSQLRRAGDYSKIHGPVSIDLFERTSGERRIDPLATLAWIRLPSDAVVEL
jgi:hypothetical protein